MSETYGNTGMQNEDATREFGTVEVAPMTGSDTLGTPGAYSGASGTATGTSDTGDTKEVVKEEAQATGQQAKDGAMHVAEVGKDEVKNVVNETGQQAKELWQQTRTQLMDQSAQQQTKVAEGLRSLSEELSSMARSSEQQGMGSDLAQQASQRMGDVAGWLDQRDPGSLVSEVKQFARQRPGTFLAAAAVIGLVGGRLSRGLVADHKDSAADAGAQSSTSANSASAATSVDHSTGGYSAYDAATGRDTLAGSQPVVDPISSETGGVYGGSAPLSGTGTGAGEFPR